MRNLNSIGQDEVLEEMVRRAREEGALLPPAPAEPDEPMQELPSDPFGEPGRLSKINETELPPDEPIQQPIRAGLSPFDGKGTLEDLARTSRERRYASTETDTNAGNVGDFVSLLAKSSAGIGNVRGKAAETAVPSYMEALKKSAFERSNRLEKADENYQSALFPKSKSAAEIGYKATESASRTALNNARAMGYINKTDYEKALTDPASSESLIARLAAAGLGMTTAPDVPGSAVQPVLKTLGGAFGVNSAYDSKLAQIESQRVIAEANAKAAFDRENAGNQSAAEIARLKAESDQARTGKVTGTALEIAKMKATEAKKAAAIKAKADKEALEFKAKNGGGKGAAVKAPTAEQRKTAGFAARVSEAIANMEKLEKSGFDRSSLKSAASGKLPEAVKPEQTKLQEQAERNFVNAVLRRESGAAISPSEFANAEVQYFARAGDTPAVKAQKRQNMKTVLATLQAEAGEKSLGDVKANQPKKKKVRLQSGFKGKRVAIKGVPYVWNETEKVYEEE